MIGSNLFFGMFVVVIVLVVAIFIVAVICHNKVLKNKDNGACSEPLNGDVKLDNISRDKITLCNVDMSKAKFSF